MFKTLTYFWGQFVNPASHPMLANMGLLLNQGFRSLSHHLLAKKHPKPLKMNNIVQYIFIKEKKCLFLHVNSLKNK